MVEDVLAKIRAGKGVSIGPASQADISKTYQNQMSVQGNRILVTETGGGGPFVSVFRSFRGEGSSTNP